MNTRLLIRDACLADGHSATLQVGVSLLIENRRIARVSADGLDPGDAEVLDGGGATIVPAFVDGHSHLTMPGGSHWIDRGSDPPDLLREVARRNAHRLVEAGILASSRGKVRLLKADELAPNWDPTTDPRLTAWEMVHQLIRALEAGGEGAAAGLVAKLGSKAEVARELCYRLYTLCERKKRAPEALSYNGLVQSWPEISRLAREAGTLQPRQAALFDRSEP